MDPNAMRVTEELTSFLPFDKGQRVLNLRCDTGLSSLLLAEKYGVTVYAYHYFGCNGFMLPTLMTFVKKGGQIAVAVSGLKNDFPNGVFPGELQPFRQPGMNFYSPAWWQALWEQTENFRVDTCREMDCMLTAWAGWLQCPNPYAQSDIPMIHAEGGKHFYLVQIIGTVIT